MDDAEKAHKELEKKFHEGNERWARIDERFDSLEQRFQQPVDEGYQRGSATVAQPESRSTETLTRFYQDPEGTLREVEERAVQRVTRSQQVAAQNERLVNDWLSRNQDVAQYPELLTYWVGQQDARLSPTKRLDAAKSKVLERLESIKGTRETVEPSAEQIIEEPGSMRATQQPVQRTQAVDPMSELRNHINERNRKARKPLGSHSSD